MSVFSRLAHHADYFTSWDEADEAELARLLKATPAHFILSTWHHNDFRVNESIGKYWADFHTVTRAHFYHAGAKEQNRRPMIEALVMNFTPIPATIEAVVEDEGDEDPVMLREEQVSLGL